MSSHTPGPWKIFEGWGADKRRPVIVDCTPDVDGKFIGNCICYLASTSPAIEENARLISAAPDMLAALKSALTLDGVSPGCEEVYNEIKAAIQKAEAAQ